MSEMMTLSGFAWQAAVTLLLFLVACVLPGSFLLRRFCLGLPAIEHFALAPAMGTAVFVALYLVLSIVHATGFVYVWLLLALLAGVRDLIRRRSLASVHRPQFASWDVLLLAAAAIVVQVRFIVGSGWYGANGMVMLNANASDAPWHLCLIAEFARHYPADTPGFAGMSLSGYHVFSDLLWAGLRRITPLNVFHLYFRVAPVVYSVLLTLTVFAAALRWSGSRPVARLATILALLSSNFGYLLPLLSPSKSFPTWDSVFLVQPPATMIVNPPTTLSFAMVLAGVWALAGWLQERRPGFLAVLALSWGLLPGFKAYAAALVLAALLCTALVLLILRRDRSLLAPLAVVVPVSILTFASMGRTGASLIQWLPGLNMATMFTLPGWMNVMSPGELATLYGRQPALAALLIGALIPVFVIGNLGMRAAALLPMARALLAWRRSDPVVLFITILTGGAMAAAALFIQKGTIFDTIQFFYYAVLLASLPAAAQYINWFDRRRPVARRALLGIVVLLGIPALVQAWTTSAMVREKYWVRPAECEAYAWINRSSTTDAVILRPLPPELADPATSGRWIERQRFRANAANPTAWAQQARAEETTAVHSAGKPETATGTTDSPHPVGWGDSLMTAAFTGRNTYLEHVRSAACRLDEGKWISRVGEVQRFYTTATAEEAQEFLHRARIRVVIVDPKSPLPFDPASAGLVGVFSNEAAVVFHASGRSAIRRGSSP